MPTVRGLIANGNRSLLNIGDKLWVQPGVKATVYSSVLSGVVVVPVATQISSKAYVLIVAFAAFYIKQSVPTPTVDGDVTTAAASASFCNSSRTVTERGTSIANAHMPRRGIVLPSAQRTSWA